MFSFYPALVSYPKSATAYFPEQFYQNSSFVELHYLKLHGLTLNQKLKQKKNYTRNVSVSCLGKLLSAEAGFSCSSTHLLAQTKPGCIKP